MTQEDIPPRLDLSKMPIPRPLSLDDRIRLTKEALRSARDEQLKLNIQQTLDKLEEETSSND
jgi:hypothetical protein